MTVNQQQQRKIDSKNEAFVEVLQFKHKDTIRMRIVAHVPFAFGTIVHEIFKTHIHCGGKCLLCG